MRHYVRATTYQVAGSDHSNHPSTTLWFWGFLGITAVILGLTSEGLACHTPKVTPTALTYYAVQGAANPPSQAITFTRTASGTVTITASDTATWLTVSPATKSVTTSAQFAAAVNTNGLSAGTRNATITVKMGTWCTYTVPVSLVLSSSTTPPPPTTTKSATLTWNAVTGATVTGYKVYVGEAPGQYSRTVTVGNVTSSTVNSLTVGRMYYFVVTAYNGAGESTPSNMVSKTIQ